MSATTPVAFAAKNDQHPLKSKRLIYAEASLARAFPWFAVPLTFLLLGFPDDFWEKTILYSSILSAVVLVFFQDKQDENCKSINTKQNKKSSPILSVFVIMILSSFFIAECSYQAIAYLVEEKEEIISLTKSYILFGLGMSITCGLQLLIKDTKGVSLRNVCSIAFFITFFYFAIRYLSFSWENPGFALSFTEKTILGAASGIYIPLIYAIVCERFKIHQQGILCGLIESTATLAEIIAPVLAFIILRGKLQSNTIFLIIGLGFLSSYAIIRGPILLKGGLQWLKLKAAHKRKRGS